MTRTSVVEKTGAFEYVVICTKSFPRSGKTERSVHIVKETAVGFQCHCQGFGFNGKCCHIEAVLAEGYRT